MISNYEVWYIHSNEHVRNSFCIATFHFRWEAEKYIETFHPTDKEYYHIKEN